jgi:eukaryotic-like serine/threonine-protein kinase
MTTYSGTTATRFAGTPQYCSPEHLGYNGKLSTRSDIYSLGLILYYLVAGVLPIGGGAIMAKQFGHPVPVLPVQERK